jgi:hypothetical protein
MNEVIPPRNDPPGHGPVITVAGSDHGQTPGVSRMSARGSRDLLGKSGKSGFGHSKLLFRGNSSKELTPTGRDPERMPTLTPRTPLYRQAFRGALQSGPRESRQL